MSQQTYQNVYPDVGSSVPEKFTVVLLGKRWDNKSRVGNKILKLKHVHTYTQSKPKECVADENSDTMVINTPDFTDENLDDLDQQIIDCMALSHPGPHVFLLVLDEETGTRQQVQPYEELFGEKIHDNTIIVTQSKTEGQSTGCIEFGEVPNISHEYIAKHGICRRFKYKYDLYTKPVVERRMCKLRHEMRITTGKMQLDGGQASAEGQEEKDITTDFSQAHKKKPKRPAGSQGPRRLLSKPISNMLSKGHRFSKPSLNIILLGESGAGKSASGNRFLGTETFKSQACSKPVTTECTVMEKFLCGTDVRIIDTPDFFNEDLEQPMPQTQKCRELCREGGLCVYLLVIQIGRFTEGERGILERLEKALETTVRDRAIILFTHGDDLKEESIDSYLLNTNADLQELTKHCGNRYQVMNNTNKSAAAVQAKQLMEKIAKLILDLDKATVFDDMRTPNSCTIA